MAILKIKTASGWQAIANIPYDGTSVPELATKDSISPSFQYLVNADSAEDWTPDIAATEGLFVIEKRGTYSLLWYSEPIANEDGTTEYQWTQVNAIWGE